MSTIDRLFEVATDHERAVLQDLSRRAGLTWDCHGDGEDPHWTNVAESTCELCDLPRAVGFLPASERPTTVRMVSRAEADAFVQSLIRGGSTHIAED